MTPGLAAAFTLVELLVVLGIIAVSASIVVPYAHGSHRSMLLRQAGLTLAQHIRYAQALAADAARPTQLLLSAPNSSYCVQLAADLTAEKFVTAPGLPQTMVVLPTGVRFKSDGFAAMAEGQTRLRFHPGQEWATGQVWLTDGQGTCLVELHEGLGHVDVTLGASADSSDGGSTRSVAPGEGYAELLAKPL